MKIKRYLRKWDPFWALTLLLLVTQACGASSNEAIPTLGPNQMQTEVTGTLAVEEHQNLNGLYVNNATGNDAANCSLTEPCKTYERAQDLFITGDVIRFDGVYPDKVTITKTGIVIDGGSIAAPQTSVNEALLIDASNIQIRNLDVSGGFAFTARTKVSAKVNNLVMDNVTVHDGVWQNRTGEKCIDAETWGRGLSIDWASNVTLTNMKIYNNCGEGLGVLNSSNVIMTNINAYDNWSRNVYIDGSQNITLSGYYAGCINPNFYRTGGGQKGVGFGMETSDAQLPLKNILIEQGMIEKCQGINLYVETPVSLTNVVIRGNKFIDVPAPLVNVPRATVSNNVTIPPP